MLTLSSHSLEKAIALLGDLTQASLDLSESILSSLYTNLTHCVWPVNFTLPLSSSTPQFAALQNLLFLSLQTPTPAPLIFCSSAGTGTASPHGPVPEAPISSFAHASPTGYTRVKLVCERIIETAVASSKANATILRISQITPSMTVGTRLWNPVEATPLMIRAGAIISSLPLGPPDMQSRTWIPLDVLAAAVCSIAGLAGTGKERATDGHAGPANAQTNGTTNGTTNGMTNSDLASYSKTPASPQLTYNLVHPRPFPWSALLPLLRTADLSFNIIPWSQWLQGLENGP